MQNRLLSSLSRFFAGAGDALATPSGDARGHVRPYPTTMRRDSQ